MLLSTFDPAVQAALDAATANSGALFPSPDDWRDHPIYFLLVDRFCNPSNPPRHRPYDAEFNGFQGGTFRGIQERLPYLKALGMGALWLSPVLRNPAWDDHAYHGYAIQNFLQIEPRLASRPDRAADELRELVDAAHALGLYVILDIVLHHAANVFTYTMDGQERDEQDWQEEAQPILWRGADGKARADWADGPQDPAPEAAVWPRELQRNDYFTRCGSSQSDAHGFHPSGDFSSLKGFDADFTEGDRRPVWDILIRAHQYLIAEFDVDGFRIDTLKFLSPEFARAFGAGVRDFAARAGKKNFFSFGEIYDTEETIARFVGRDRGDKTQPVGADAAMDYPLFFHLPPVIKAAPDAVPADVAAVFQTRAAALKGIEVARGRPGDCYVTFLDNQDQDARFGWTGRRNRADALSLGLGCLFTLPGVPCLYYGTEQGLTGHKTRGRMDDSHVREALWGKRAAFSKETPLFQTVAALTALRQSNAVLRRGDTFFRQLSSDGKDFDLSRLPAGVLAFSRLLGDAEVLVVANTNPDDGWAGEVLIDGGLHAAGDQWQVLWANRPDPAVPAAVRDKPTGSVTICEEDGRTGEGPDLALPVTLRPAEIQILAPVGA